MSAKIAVLPGDGIGPEVVAEALKVLRAVAERFGQSFTTTEGLIGGIALDTANNPLPDETLATCRASDAVLLGAVGGPQWDNPGAAQRPEQGLLAIRKGLGLFANLRPVRAYPSLLAAAPLRPDIIRGVDMVVVRELTGGLYFGQHGRSEHPSGEQAFDTMIYSTGEVERITRFAARLAQQRGGRLTSVDKANVLESSRLWRSTVTRVMQQEFPDVTLDHILVDAAAMYLIQNPRRFDVVVTENMFGDILTDEASVLAGSMGLLPSASIGDGGPGLYEPIHGSAPDIAGRGIANPLGTILCVAMMCRLSLGWADAANCIEAAVDSVLAGGVRTIDIAQHGEASIGTAEMGDRIAALASNIDLPAKEGTESTCAAT